MAKMIALIFQGIEGLILDAPAGTPSSHDFIDVVFADLYVGYRFLACADGKSALDDS